MERGRRFQGARYHHRTGAGARGRSSTPPARADVTAPLDGLLAGLRLALGTGVPDADRAALARVDDWRAVLALARRHRVAALLLKGLRAAPGLLCASGIEPELGQLRDRTVHRGLRQLDGLKQATDCLAAHDIPCIVLKGLPLSQRLYGHPLAKDMIDIDLLVSPRTLPAAEGALRERGWRRVEPSFPETPVRNRWYAGFVHDRVLVGPGGRLELHQRLSDNPRYLDAPFESLYANGSPVGSESAPTRALGDDDQLLYLACHGTRHYWRRLKWLCDTAALLASLAPDSLERVVVRCREAKLDSVLASTLALCREAFHVDVPGAAAASSTSGRRAAFLVRFARRTWDGTSRFGNPEWIATGQTLAGLAAKPGLRYALREIAGLTVRPGDWGRIDLPDRLFLLYFPLRPVLWLAKRARKRTWTSSSRPRGTDSPAPASPPGGFRRAPAHDGHRLGLMKLAPARPRRVRAFGAFVRARAATKALALEAAWFLLLARLLVEHVPMRRWRHRLDTAQEPGPMPGGGAGRPGGTLDSAPDPRGAPVTAAGAGVFARPVAAQCGRSAPAGRVPEQHLPRKVARIVRKVARHVPFRAVCLPQAMAAQWMLRRRGVPSRLVFGVRRGTADSGLQYHAWLMVGRECVVGAGEVETYAPLTPLDRAGAKRPGRSGAGAG